MTQTLLFALTAAGLFGIGLYGLLTGQQLLRKVLALNLMGSAVFLLLIALARRDPTGSDPVPHALVLTGIVIAVSATAFALSLIRRLHRERGDSDREESP